MSFGFSGFRHLPIISGLALSLFAGSAGATECPAGLPPPKVNLTVEHGTLRIDHGLDAEQIGALRGRLQGASALRPVQGRTVGLTVAALRIGKGTRGRLHPAGPGRWCVQVTDIDLRIGFLDQTVYVPRGYAAGSCEYDTVLEHEKAHVTDNLTILDDMGQSFKDRAEVLALTMASLIVASREEAEAVPLARLGAALEPLAADFAEAQARHAARRDTQEEYAAIAARCGNW